MEFVRERPREARSCPYCHDAFADGAEQTTCEGCATVLHTDCWTELGGCATIGCAHRAEPGKGARVADSPGLQVRDKEGESVFGPEADKRRYEQNRRERERAVGERNRPGMTVKKAGTLAMIAIFIPFLLWGFIGSGAALLGFDLVGSENFPSGPLAAFRGTGVFLAAIASAVVVVWRGDA